MVTTLQDIQTHAAQPQGAQYRYDQLNRIKEMQVWQNMDVVNNQWQSSTSTGSATTALSDYRTSYRYDANGNILNLNRNGHNSVNLAMDSLSYHYIAGTNRLAYVDDAVASGNYSVDIDDQAVGNYAYDATGNLIKDVAEEIDSIVWTAYGKVLRVVRSSVSSKPDLHFAYGPDGNRLSKKAVYGNDSTVWTFYVRDAQGNTMATYRHKESSGVLHLTDHVMYGSSRLGSHERKHVELLGAGSSPITARAGIFGLERCDKRYELSNHLGNVLAVVSDRRAKASCADTLVSGYWADVISTSDYYPFGMGMVERGDDGGYRYGFNGQERDDEVAGAGNSYTAEFWQYDARLGRRWKLDKFSTSYPWFSPYSAMENSPIWKIDTKGDSTTYYWRGKIVWISHDGLPNAIVSLNLNEAQMNVFSNQLELHRNAGTADTDAANRLARKFGTVMPVRMLEDFANGNFEGRMLVGEKRDFRFAEVGAYTFFENNVLIIGDQYSYGDSDDWTPNFPPTNSKGTWTFRRIHLHPAGNEGLGQKFPSDLDLGNESGLTSIFPHITIDKDYIFFHNPSDPMLPDWTPETPKQSGIAFSRQHLFDKRILENGKGDELWNNLSLQKEAGEPEKSPTENLGLTEE